MLICDVRRQGIQFCRLRRISTKVAAAYAKTSTRIYFTFTVKNRNYWIYSDFKKKYNFDKRLDLNNRLNNISRRNYNA